LHFAVGLFWSASAIGDSCDEVAHGGVSTGSRSVCKSGRLETIQTAARRIWRWTVRNQIKSSELYCLARFLIVGRVTIVS
jgi:hypothetical protein